MYKFLTLAYNKTYIFSVCISQNTISQMSAGFGYGCLYLGACISDLHLFDQETVFTIQKSRKIIFSGKKKKCAVKLGCGELHIEGFQPEWYYSTMIFSRDIPFWLEILNMHSTAL